MLTRGQIYQQQKAQGTGIKTRGMLYREQNPEKKSYLQKVLANVPKAVGDIPKNAATGLGIYRKSAEAAGSLLTAPLIAPLLQMKSALNPTEENKRKATAKTFEGLGGILSFLPGVGGAASAISKGVLSGGAYGAGAAYENPEVKTVKQAISSPQAAGGAALGGVAAAAPIAIAKGKAKVDNLRTQKSALETLGLDSKATPEQVTNAYRNKVKASRSASGNIADTQALTELSAARKTLGNKGPSSLDRLLMRVVPNKSAAGSAPIVTPAPESPVQRLMATTKNNPARETALKNDLTGRQMQDLGQSTKQVVERAITDTGKTQSAVETFKKAAQGARTQGKTLEDLISMSKPKQQTVSDLGLNGVDDIADVPVVFDSKATNAATIGTVGSDGSRFAKIVVNPNWDRSRLQSSILHEQVHAKDVLSGKQVEASTPVTAETLQWLNSDEGAQAFQATKARMPAGTSADDIGRQVLFDRYQARPEEVRARAAVNEALTPVEGTGEVVRRKLAEGVEAKAVEKKLTEGFGDLPEYNRVNMKDQAQKAESLISSDYDTAKNIALGLSDAPQGVLPESVFVAVENKAIKEGDVDLLRDLATSSRTAEATTMGQRIRTLAERDPNSAVNSIKRVVEVRKEAAKRRNKNFDESQKQTAAEIKKQVQQSAPKKDEWASFLDEIRCK